MKAIQLSFNEYTSNLVLKIQKMLPLYILAIIIIAITFSNLIISDFRKSLHVAHVFNTSATISVFTPIYVFSAILFFLVLIFVLSYHLRKKMRKVLSKFHLLPTTKSAEIFFLILSYFCFQSVGIFIVTGVGHLIKHFLFISLFQIFMLSISLIYFSLIFSVLGILILALVNILDLYGVGYIKSIVPILTRNARTKFIKLIKPTVLYNDFKIARLLAVPIVLIMIYSNCYKNFMAFFDNNYSGFIFSLFVVGSLFIVGLEKIKPNFYHEISSVIRPMLDEIQTLLRYLNFLLMLFIMIYCVFLFLEMRFSIDYYTNLFNKLVGLILLTIAFEIFANMIQPISKSIHNRKIKYKSPKISK